MMIATSGVISGFSAYLFGITEKAGESPSIYIQAKNPSEGIPPELLGLINHTNIKQVLPIAEIMISFYSEEGSFNCYVVGVNFSEFLNYYSRAEVFAGRLPRSNASSPECLVGKDLSTIVGSSEINISDSLVKTKRELVVVGIVQNVKEFQSAILLDITDYTSIFNENLTPNLYQRIKIQLKNRYFVEDTLSSLNTLLKDYRPILTIKPEQQADIFTTSLFSDIIYQLNLLFGFLFIIALIRIFHAVSWFVRNYERDLLIMRSMGMSSTQLAFLVVFLAELIGNIGLFVGILFGILIPPLLFTILSLFFAGGFLVPEFDITIIILLFILSNIIAVLAAVFPVIIINRKKPSTLSLSTHDMDR